ncbi:DUF3592 domain-containing protein [Myroides sp. N17-2]|uniref:DUF3592 domain-containing protein n=1 Tax=Myroides sp. N17-2 TaxID=2030799 RepID=UPI000EFCECFB|nr:DUF3592 domain-containing protein [Myroides sp. N17-2]
METRDIFLGAVIGGVISSIWLVLKCIHRDKEAYSKLETVIKLTLRTMVVVCLLLFVMGFMAIRIVKDLDTVVNGDKYVATVVYSEEPHFDQMKLTGNLSKVEFITKEGETKAYSFFSPKEATNMPRVGDVYTIYYNSDNSSLLEVNWENIVVFLARLMGFVVGLIALRLFIKLSLGTANRKRLSLGIKVAYGVVVLFYFGIFYVFYKMENLDKWVIFVIGSTIVVVAVLVLRYLTKLTKKESIITGNVLDEAGFNSKK